MDTPSPSTSSGHPRTLLQVETVSLYPALHRLEARGWIAAAWELSEAGKRAKFYRLTAQGRKQLQAEQTKWRVSVVRSDSAA